MGGLGSVGVVVAVAAVALMTPSAAAPAKAKAGACQRAKSRTVAENRFARVYTRPTVRVKERSSSS